MGKAVLSLVLSMLIGTMIFGLIGVASAVSIESCLELGQSTGAPYPTNDNLTKDCCAGLTKVSDCYNPGLGRGCEMMVGCGSVCVKSGDGVCGAGENVCNSPKDCNTNAVDDAEMTLCSGTSLQMCANKGECEAVSGEWKNGTCGGCKNLYWFDDTNKSCGQSEFCGAFMYFGLHTYESKTQCLKALNESNTWNETTGCACTMDAKDCGNGKYVGRVCPDCEFAPCNGEENKTRNRTQERENETKYFNLSNGRKALIKIMPSTASATAIARLGELNFTVELKEVGQNRTAYELTANKQGKMFGLFKIKGEVKTQVDAETGEVIKVKKPWWAFLASGI